MALKLFLTLFLFSSSVFAKDILVLIPGAASSGEMLWLKYLNPIFRVTKHEKYFSNFEKILRNNGFKTLTCPQKLDEDTSSLLARTRQCFRDLAKFSLKNPDVKFHLIGHSMGGLVGRALLDRPLINRKILSLTTISTPHYGALLSNYSFEHENENGVVGRFLRFSEFTSRDKKYLKDLYYPESSFRNNLTNKKNIPVFSISNYKTNFYNTPFEVTKRILSAQIKKHRDEDSNNDGIVETVSMVYGTHLGKVKADHMESACILYTVKSRGCKSTMNLLLKHLKSIQDPDRGARHN